MAAPRDAARAASIAVRPSRVFAATAIALVLATGMDLVIEALARRAFAISPDFPPFQGTVGPYTAGGVALAGLAFWAVSRVTPDVGRAFPRIAIVTLVLSWLPDVGLLVIDEPGVSVPAVLSLMTMHAVSAAIVTVLLVRLGAPS